MTLLIDSEQLESGDALDENFRDMAADEIERFRRELRERGDRATAENITDQDLVAARFMNTVGKEGRLGESVRCVVSVGMLTEGWDCNTVTHILGVHPRLRHALLCEQVVGQRLAPPVLRPDNEDNKFNVEYADVLESIPFDLPPSPVVAAPKSPTAPERPGSVKRAAGATIEDRPRVIARAASWLRRTLKRVAFRARKPWSKVAGARHRRPRATTSIAATRSPTTGLCHRFGTCPRRVSPRS